MQKIKTTRIFKWLNEADTRINLLVGGAGSSKSYSVAQFLIKKFYEEENIRILVCRKTTPSLRISAYKLVLDLLKEYGWPYGLNKTEMVITYGNNEILFKGLDDPEKIKSAEFNYEWVEEATEVTLEDWRQLNLRLRRKGKNNQMYLTCNPVSALHWVKTELVDKSLVNMHHSTYKDNPFLNDVYRQQLEQLIHQDVNFYKIYALGEWGVLENLIYSGWQVVDEPQKYDDISWGIDWAFNTPSAIIKAYWIDGKFVWQEVFYGGGLTQDELVTKAEQLIPVELRRKDLFIDAAEPALIQSFFNRGFNAKSAKKDIQDGISYVKTHLAGVVKDNPNLIKEIQSYSWKQDKNGNVIDDPVKFNDHLMDAGRYATYSMHRAYGRGSTLKIAFR